MDIKAYFLVEGYYGHDTGKVVVISENKQNLIKWVEINRPNHKKRDSKYKLFWEDDSSQTWLRHRLDLDECPLIN